MSINNLNRGHFSSIGLQILVITCLLFGSSACNKGDTSGESFSLRKLVLGQGKNEDRRWFIAHRGVNLRSTIAGENSLESIRYAKMAGFDFVETDVRLTSDSILVVNHDLTINRILLNLDGTEILDNILVSSLTLDELKSLYILRSDNRNNNSSIPTLKEFLEECKRNALIPFIEPKLINPPDSYYRNIIRLADEVMGKYNYVITSNNAANKAIRARGYEDVILMGILYQTTFKEIEELDNVIMAISTSQFSNEEYTYFIAKAKSTGLLTESHGDNFERFQMINNNGTEIVSTDLLAPDLRDDMDVTQIFTTNAGFNDFSYSGMLKDNILHLEVGDTIELAGLSQPVMFGGMFLEIKINGECDVSMCNQKFTIDNMASLTYKYQLMIYDEVPVFRLIAKNSCVVSGIDLKVVEYGNH